MGKEDNGLVNAIKALDVRVGVVESKVESATNAYLEGVKVGIAFMLKQK